MSERSDLVMGEAGDGSSDAPMDMAMRMATAVTPIAAETAGASTVEPRERNKKGTRRTRSDAPATAFAPEDWRSCIEPAAQPQARELAQLHRTIAKLAHMLETQNALKEAQWRGMTKWLEEPEEKRSVSNGSKFPGRFRFRFHPKPDRGNGSDHTKNPAHWKWAGFTTKNPAFQHHNFASN